MEITILCKVVDNFGDIGVVYRLSKGLVEVAPKFGYSVFEDNQNTNDKKLNINVVVDDLNAFHKINSKVDSELSYQKIDGLNIYSWNDYELCYKTFSENDGEKLSIILECFQCGRPDWMEKILFDDKLERTVQIIMIDYLTAEKYAEDFHLLDSLTRSKKVQKINFMPGFTEKTGGLIIGKDWEELTAEDFEDRPIDKTALIFTYDRDWTGLALALKQCGIISEVAQGKGKDSFLEACQAVEYEEVTELPFVDQEEWDGIMQQASMLFIRGEESMSRACLSGIPFVWHAYPQSDEYQLVKVKALLDRMERHFDPEDFEIVKNIWLDFNSPEEDESGLDFEADCVNFIENADKLAYGFQDFALSLLKNGDLCSNLMTFICKKVIL